nr:genome-linked viral protein [Camellia virus A]
VDVRHGLLSDRPSESELLKDNELVRDLLLNK